MTHFINDFLFKQTINISFINFINETENWVWKDLSSNCISGGVGFEYQFFVKDMRMDFPTNHLISGKSSSKTFLVETEDNESESVFSSETISFSFLEIVRAALVEYPQF